MCSPFEPGWGARARRPTVVRSSDLLDALANLHRKAIRGFLRVAQKHVSVLLSGSFSGRFTGRRLVRGTGTAPVPRRSRNAPHRYRTSAPGLNHVSANGRAARAARPLATTWFLTQGLPQQYPSKTTTIDAAEPGRWPVARVVPECRHERLAGLVLEWPVRCLDGPWKSHHA